MKDIIPDSIDLLWDSIDQLGDNEFMYSAGRIKGLMEASKYTTPSLDISSKWKNINIRVKRLIEEGKV